MTARPPTPTASAAPSGLAVAHALDEAAELVDEAVGVDREPEQLGELARPGW